VAGDLIVDQLRQRTGNLPPDPGLRRLLQQVAGPQCDHWLRILDEATEADVALLAATGVDDRHRDAAQRFILARRLATAPGPADLRKVTRQLRAVYGHSDEHMVSLLMDACLACSPSDPPSPLPYVSFVLECLDAGTLAVSRSGQLENRALHRTAQQVVESLGETDRRTASRQAEPGAGDEARHRPDAVVVPVLRPALPRHAVVARQVDVGGARFDGAPADRLTVEVGDQTRRPTGVRVAGIDLLPKPLSAFLDRKPGEGLSRPQLVALALAPGGSAAPAEDRLKVVPARLVGRHDDDHSAKDATAYLSGLA
jgi:hypothetical protein